MELYADATGCTVVEPQAADAVLLGTAMVAATAAGLYPGSRRGLPGHAAGRRRAHARTPHARQRFDRDYRVFLEMHRQRRELDAMG